MQEQFVLVFVSWRILSRSFRHGLGRAQTDANTEMLPPQTGFDHQWLKRYVFLSNERLALDRPIPHPTALCPWRSACVRNPWRLCTGILRFGLPEQVAPDQHLRRAGRRLCGGCLRTDSRTRRGLRHLLRWWFEGREHDGRGLRRKITGRRDQRSAGNERAREKSPAPP